MEQFQKNWWKFLPFILFFLGTIGVILFFILLIIYLLARFVPIDPKRGKLLTWLIIIDFIILLLYFVNVFYQRTPFDEYRWLEILSNVIEIALLIGILKWKKLAAVGFILLTIFEFVIAGFQGYTNSSPWSVNLSGVLLVLTVYLVVWIIAFKRKWSFFK